MKKWDFEVKKVKIWASEADLQNNVIKWARINAKNCYTLNFLTASLNGVKLTPVQVVLAKKSGMNKGFPDLELPAARRGYHGLYIEMKRSDGVLSDDQIRWQKYLVSEGYKHVVARSDEYAIKIIKWYLGINF
jgi:hypothetical protein